MGGSRYTLTYNPVRKMMVDKDNLMRLKGQFRGCRLKTKKTSEKG